MFNAYEKEDTSTETFKWTHSWVCPLAYAKNENRRGFYPFKTIFFATSRIYYFTQVIVHPRSIMEFNMFTNALLLFIVHSYTEYTEYFIMWLSGELKKKTCVV